MTWILKIGDKVTADLKSKRLPSRLNNQIFTVTKIQYDFGYLTPECGHGVPTDALGTPMPGYWEKVEDAQPGAPQAQGKSEGEYRAFMLIPPGECVCGIKRVQCDYHKA